MLSTALMGQTGPDARLAGYGNIGAALSGFQNIAGWPDRPPLGPYGAYTDYLGPRFSLTTLLAALDQRQRTGARLLHRRVASGGRGLHAVARDGRLRA